MKKKLIKKQGVKFEPRPETRLQAILMDTPIGRELRDKKIKPFSIFADALIDYLKVTEEEKKQYRNYIKLYQELHMRLSQETIFQEDSRK